MSVKKILRDLFIILLVTIVLLALIEVSLRLFFPELKNIRYAPGSLAFEYNKDYLVALKPNVTKEYRKIEKDEHGYVVWKTNSMGFRGPELGEKKGTRIIVYGDSNVHARFSPYEDTYPAVLQKLLRAKGKNVQVINAGMTASGPDQSLLRLYDDYEKVKPDIVIFHIFVENDYGDIIKNRLFKLSPTGELIKSGFPVTVDQRFTSLKYKVVDWLKPFYIQGAIYYLVKKFHAQKEHALSREEKVAHTLSLIQNINQKANQIYLNDQPRAFSHFKDYYDIDVATEPSSKTALIKTALMEKILLAAKQFCDGKHIQFMVTVQPSIHDLSRDRGYWGYEDLAKKYKNYSPDNLTNPLKKICQRHQLNCIHLVDIYRRNHPDTLYRHDGHWNAKGQKLAAQATAEKLLYTGINTP